MILLGARQIGKTYIIRKFLEENSKSFVEFNLYDDNLAKEAFEKYGVDGVMIGRATIGKPWIFKQIKHYFETGEILPDLSVAEQLEILKEQIELSMDWIDEVRGILHMRRHMAAMFKGLPNFRDLRIRMLQANDKESLWQIFNEIEERYQ